MFNANEALSAVMQQKLMNAGLTKQQAMSATAKVCADIFMPEDGKVLMQEAYRHVAEAQRLVNDMKEKQRNVTELIESIGQTVSAIASAQGEYGFDSLDERAKSALCMYSAILDMNKKVGVSGDESVDAASYCVYAYLGGQAKREITLHDNSAKKNEIFKNIQRI